jgi:hypothetical protein
MHQVCGGGELKTELQVCLIPPGMRPAHRTASRAFLRTRPREHGRHARDDAENSPFSAGIGGTRRFGAGPRGTWAAPPVTFSDTKTRECQIFCVPCLRGAHELLRSARSCTMSLRASSLFDSTKSKLHRDLVLSSEADYAFQLAVNRADITNSSH